MHLRLKALCLSDLLLLLQHAQANANAAVVAAKGETLEGLCRVLSARHQAVVLHAGVITVSTFSAPWITQHQVWDASYRRVMSDGYSQTQEKF